VVYKIAICIKVIDLLGGIINKNNMTGINYETVCTDRHWVHKLAIVFSQYLDFGVAEPVVLSFVALRLLYTKGQKKAPVGWLIAQLV